LRRRASLQASGSWSPAALPGFGCSWAERCFPTEIELTMPDHFLQQKECFPKWLHVLCPKVSMLTLRRRGRGRHRGRAQGPHTRCFGHG
jgi:hypothetical protein